MTAALGLFMLSNQPFNTLGALKSCFLLRYFLRGPRLWTTALWRRSVSGIYRYEIFSLIFWRGKSTKPVMAYFSFSIRHFFAWVCCIFSVYSSGKTPTGLASLFFLKLVRNFNRPTLSSCITLKDDLVACRLSFGMKVLLFFFLIWNFCCQIYFETKDIFADLINDEFFKKTISFFQKKGQQKNRRTLREKK